MPVDSCYYFVPLRDLSPCLSASVWASWAGAIGTLLPAVIALFIFHRSQAIARADLVRRRNVLHAMLVERVRKAVRSAKFINDRVQSLQTSDEHLVQTFRDGASLLQVPRLDRLIELQAQLVSFGTKGDQEIAAFIETCRLYHEALSECIELSQRSDDAARLDLPTIVLKACVHEMSIHAKAAKAAIGAIGSRN